MLPSDNRVLSSLFQIQDIVWFFYEALPTESVDWRRRFDDLAFDSLDPFYASWLERPLEDDEVIRWFME